MDIFSRNDENNWVKIRGLHTKWRVHQRILTWKEVMRKTVGFDSKEDAMDRRK